MKTTKGYDQYVEISKWIRTFTANAEKFYVFGNKSACARARKALDQMCKLRIAWKKATIHGDDK